MDNSLDRSSLRILSECVTSQGLPLGVLVNQSDHVKWLSESIVQIPVGCL